ncbi:hypothetical protein JG688_00008448 [Phytophthora aleatoria]|uniref:Uncharacterized protein n=1 Tax=Phytophthora aleatoria TaxID=2496075 RepID=A0A8J5J808_9STRA|nr:hypothetical protein JG688_00008448 [Phytophthora aleatoria]
MIYWEKRTRVRFVPNATESDCLISIARAPQGAPDHSVANAVASGAHAQVATTVRVVESVPNPISDSERGSIQKTDSCRDDNGASTPGVHPSYSEGFPVTDSACDDSASVPGTDATLMQGARAKSSSFGICMSAPGVDTAVIVSNITEGSVARQQGDRSVLTPGVNTNSTVMRRGVNSASAYSRASGLHDEVEFNQAGLDYARPRKEFTDGYENNRNPSKVGPGRGTSGAWLHKEKKRHNRRKQRKSRSGTRRY